MKSALENDEVVLWLSRNQEHGHKTIVRAFSLLSYNGFNVLVGYNSHDLNLPFSDF